MTEPHDAPSFFGPDKVPRCNVIGDNATVGGGECVVATGQVSSTVRRARTPPKELHIAPMIHASTIEFRSLMRILSKHCVIWTEMVVDETLVHQCQRHPQRATTESDASPPHHLLDPVRPHDEPIVCQIGGIRPDWTSVATRMMLQAGYTTELNLNLDCPSNRVQGKRFGAILMKDPDTTIALIDAMHEQCRTYGTHVSIKCRVGLADESRASNGTNCATTMHSTDYEWMEGLLEQLTTRSACRRFVLHARPVVLQGLTPAQNRLVPPLNYPFVYRLCRRFPSCTFILNGGLSGLEAAHKVAFGVAPDSTLHETNESGWDHAVPCQWCRTSNGSCVVPPTPVPPNLQGCMLGRAALDHPMQFWDVDRYWYGAAVNPVSCRRQVLQHYGTLLRQLYPPRCCDDDDIVTDRLPAPVVVQTRLYCNRCRVDPCAKGHGTNDHESARTSPFSVVAPKAPSVKISTRVMDRSFKPVLNMFFRQPGAKAFRRACETLSRDTTIRNCGPAFVLQTAVAMTIADAVLDEPLVRTEDLRPGDVVEHTSPDRNHSSSGMNAP